jgi:hypothetical protein
MKARIIAKNHIVSTVHTQYLCNGKNVQRTETHVTLKPIKACSTVADRIVFRAIHLSSHKWEDVQNNLDANMSERMIGSLDKEINRHTI